MSSNNDSFEIHGEKVYHKINGVLSKEIPLRDFIQSIQYNGERELFPGILPHGIRYIVERGNLRVTVVEQAPGPRAVYVISKDSPAPYGPSVKSERRWLSFPYVILLILFSGPSLSGYQQVFYRTEPLKSLEDKLYLCNLPNVSTVGPGNLPYWFCSQYIKGIREVNWPDKIKRIVDHLWKSGFNWSSDFHEGLSQFNAMKNLDKRISSFQIWEEETKKKQDVALDIKWKSTEKSLRQWMDELFNYVAPKKDINNSKQLADILFAKKKPNIFF